LARFFTSTWTSSPGRAVSIRLMARPLWRSRSDSRLTPWRRSTRWNVDAGTPILGASRAGPNWFRRRSSTIWRSTRAGVLVGHRRGRLDRSSRPATPASQYRFHHLWAVCREIRLDSAAAATVQSFSISRQSRSLPSAVSGALRCMTSLPGTVWVCRQLHTASGAHFISGTFASTRSMGRTPRTREQSETRGIRFAKKSGLLCATVPRGAQGEVVQEGPMVRNQQDWAGLCRTRRRTGPVRGTPGIVRDTRPEGPPIDPRAAQRPRSGPGPWMLSDEYLGEWWRGQCVSS
jgi:hypothetical protein